MPQNPSLVILAAGIGSRYGGLKQLDPVGPSGEIVIDYSIYDALKVGFGKLVFVIRRDIEDAFRDAVGRRFENIADVHYVFQELESLPAGYSVPADRQKPWGTGHAVLVAKEAINEPFAVINADDFYGRRGYQLLHDHLSQEENQDTYALVGFALRNTLSEFGSVARGLCTVDEANCLRRVVEATEIYKDGDHARSRQADGSDVSLTGDEWVSMNMWGFSPSLLPRLEAGFRDFLETRTDNPKAEFFLPGLVDELIQTHTVQTRVLPSADAWFGVTYKEDKPHVIKSVQQLVADGAYPENLWG
jgi:NDP-sugar pyrophosphorylase family protein